VDSFICNASDGYWLPHKTGCSNVIFHVWFVIFLGPVGHFGESHFNIYLLIFSSIAVIIASQIGKRVMKNKI